MINIYEQELCSPFPVFMLPQKVYNMESRSSFIYKILYVGLNVFRTSHNQNLKKRLYLLKRREFMISVYSHYIPAGNMMLDEEQGDMYPRCTHR